jgi:hypothetical protein
LKRSAIRRNTAATVEQAIRCPRLTLDPFLIVEEHIALFSKKHPHRRRGIPAGVRGRLSMSLSGVRDHAFRCERLTQQRRRSKLLVGKLNYLATSTCATNGRWTTLRQEPRRAVRTRRFGISRGLRPQQLETKRNIAGAVPILGSWRDDLSIASISAFALG